jgi:CRP-like cAMP-binding protein
MVIAKCYENVRSSPLAIELNDAQAQILAELVESRNLKDGDILIREGEVGNELHVIVAGHVAVTRESGNADWITLHVLRPRDLAGELGFLDDLEHSATLRAMGPTEIFSLKRDRLETLIDTQPRIVYLVMRAIVREIHGILRRMNIQHVELSNYISKQHGRY